MVSESSKPLTIIIRAMANSSIAEIRASARLISIASKQINNS